MSRVLYIVGSPRGAASVSNQLATAFLAAYRAAHPHDEIDTLDVWAEELPVFGGDAANGKLKAMAGMQLPAAEQAAYAQVLAHIERFKAADKVVVSSGMWNFGVPYRLKHYIDILVQAGHTFGFDPARGYFGLVTGRPLQLLLASGGDFSSAPMSSYDMMSPYLQNVFAFVGFADIRTLNVGCTAYPPEVSAPAIAAAVAAATDAGAAF